jgi:molecular chaperone GrpE
MSEKNKGHFEADIAAEAVAEALQSVEKQRDGGEEIDVEAPAEAGELGDLRRQLAEKDAMLEESLRRGRESMDRLREVNERMLRYAADLENYKKRAAKEKEEIRKFGIEKLLRDLLPVLDNFDRALAQAEQGADLRSFSTGVQMTRRLFEETLGRFEVASFSAVGQPFDPQLHEALQQVESAEVPPGTVVSEMVRGYTLAGRLVRPALVVVSRAPADAAREPNGDGAAGPGESPDGG